MELSDFVATVVEDAGRVGDLFRGRLFYAITPAKR